jgi:hypothetical protein
MALQLYLPGRRPQRVLVVKHPRPSLTNQQHLPMCLNVKVVYVLLAAHAGISPVRIIKQHRYPAACNVVYEVIPDGVLDIPLDVRARLTSIYIRVRLE